MRLLPPILLLAACGAPSDARRLWLIDRLVQDNLVWMSRDPALLAGKFSVMAADPYDYMRGSASVFLADQARPGTDRPATAFLRDPDAGTILLAGDPHPENFGTFWSDGALRIDLNDLDGAAHGPWLWDLRRACLGLGVGFAADGDRTGASFVGPIQALARAYVDEITREQAGEPAVDTRERGAFGVLVEDLLVGQEEKIAEDAVRAEWAPVADGVRALADLSINEVGRGQLPLTDDESIQLAALLQRWETRPAGFRVLDVARRFGVGVASRPAVRYAVLWDQGVDGPDDDQLLQLREVVDPPAVPGRVRDLPGPYADQADRVMATARSLWAAPQLDPLFVALTDGVMTFKLQSWSDRQEGFEHEALLDAATSTADLEGLADLMGRILAAAHARAPRLDRQPGLAVLADEVVGRGDELADELVLAAAADVARTLTDHALFVAALDERGPWLGADAVFARRGEP